MSAVQKHFRELFFLLVVLFLHLGEAFPSSPPAVPSSPPERLQFAGNKRWIPFQFVDETGAPAGYGVEIVRALCDELGARCDIVLYDNWERAREDVAAGRMDAIVGFMKTPERASRYDFSQTIAAVNSVIAVRSDTRGVVSIEDLFGTAVAAVEGTPDLHFLQSYGKIHVNAVPGQETGLKMLAKREVAAFVGTDLSIRYTVKVYGLKGIRIVGRPLSKREYVIGVAKGNTELLERINTGLRLLEKKRVVDTLYTEWFGQEILPQNIISLMRHALHGMLVLSAVTIGVILILLFFNKKHERAGSSRTSELSRKNRVLVLLSECEKVLIFSRSESELLNKICGIIVKTGGYESAWIGFKEGKEGWVLRQAASEGSASLPSDRLSELDPSTENRNGICVKHVPTVLQTGKPYLCKGVSKAGSGSGSRSPLVSCLLLPVSANGEPIGAVCMCSADADAFGGEETRLLEELIENLAFGIATFRAEKQLELLRQELSEKNKFLTNIGESMQDGFAIADPEGKILGVNPLFCRMTGFCSEELVGTGPPYPFWPPEEQSRIMEFYRIAHVSTMDSYELVFTRKGGERFHAVVAPTTMKNDGGEVVARFATFKDITAQKRREELLHTTGEELKAIIASTPVAIIILDTDCKVQMWNPAAEKIFGWAASEVIGNTYPLVPSDREEEFINEKTQLMKNEPIDIEETKRMTKDGRLVDVSVSTAPLVGPDGCVNGFIEVVSDITRRKKDERNLMESRRKLRVYAAHVQRISEEEKKRISRDLHDHLAQVLAALKIDLTVLYNKISREKENGLLVLIKKELITMKSIADGLIKSLRRMISELRPETLDRLGLVDAIQWQLKEFEGKTGIACEPDFGMEKVEVGKERALSVYRIIQEALNNVARHADAKRLKVSLHRNHDRYNLRISDDGVGFLPGAGEGENTFGILGMRERAEMLGGELTVESSPGRGTTVSLKFSSR